MDLASLVDVAEFRRMIEAGYIKEQQHPLVPLTIFNYTPRAQYERVWNDCTRMARGLIVDHWQAVVSRPFPKFFNFGELADDEIPRESFDVYDKMDGSLGILYPLGEGFAVATRGSFSSSQAKHATDVYIDRYDDAFAPKPGLTYLFEIIYPENRIVVDYGGMDDLVLLDVVDNVTGHSRLDEEAIYWPGPVVKLHPHFTVLDDLLAAPHRDNEEGYVIRFSSGMRAKLKHDEYVRLHRIITGVSTKTIWEHLSSGQKLDSLLENVPDEFYDWVKQTAAELRRQYEELEQEIGAEYVRIDKSLPAFFSRRDFAELATKSKHPSAMFSLLDGKRIDQYIWKLLKPAFEKPFMSQSEDVA